MEELDEVEDEREDECNSEAMSRQLFIRFLHVHDNEARRDQQLQGEPTREQNRGPLVQVAGILEVLLLASLCHLMDLNADLENSAYNEHNNAQVVEQKHPSHWMFLACMLVHPRDTKSYDHQWQVVEDQEGQEVVF